LSNARCSRSTAVSIVAGARAGYDRGVVHVVTGASGFVGYHVAKVLCAHGERVRVMLRATSRRDHLASLPVEIVAGDLGDPASLAVALRGASHLYHVAAAYTFGSRDPAHIYADNVEGTRNVLRAAGDAGVKRVVYTSTVGALATSRRDTISNEDTPVSPRDMISHYKRSKFMAQQVAEEFARNGLDVVIVNPSAPIGPVDAKPTPTGKMIVDFLRGKMPAYVDTGLNVIAVEDVAEGHRLAAEKGRAGEKYILGNQNMHLREILALLAKVSGRPRPRVRIPHAVAYAAAACSEVKASLTRSEPEIPMESVRLARHFMYFDSSKAVRELGLPQTSVEAALARAVTWYREHGYAP
jgi:dihydroflavonol-4-reductase